MIEGLDACAEVEHSSMVEEALFLLLLSDINPDSGNKAGEDDCCEVSSVLRDPGPPEGGVEEFDV